MAIKIVRNNPSTAYKVNVVIPPYIDGESGEDEKLRCSYRDAFKLAIDEGIDSVALPLMPAEYYGYTMADVLNIAVEEINGLGLVNKLDVYIVVLGDKDTSQDFSHDSDIQPGLKNYIDKNYIDRKYVDCMPQPCMAGRFSSQAAKENVEYQIEACADQIEAFQGEMELDKAVEHLADPFGVYFFYLVDKKGLKSSDVQNKAWITKQVYSKINKNRENYHPDKRTALQLCIGLELNIDETKDFLARAGYAFSSSDLQDIIFRFFIENECYDIIDISDALEKYGLKPILNF